MKNSLWLDRLLSSNRFVIFLAVLIAVVVWMTVAMGADTDQTIDRVRVEMPDLSALGLSVIGTEEHYVSLEIFGARTIVGQLSPDDFVASVNVAQVRVPGDYDLSIVVESPTMGILIERIYPETISVTLDHIDSQMFEVNWEITGLASAPGYMADIPRLAPVNSVWITGPRAELERIGRVAVIAELEEALDGPWVEELPVTLLDIAGEEINPQDTQLQLEHESLILQIPVLRMVTLPVVLDFQNMPSGFPEELLRAYMQKSVDEVTIAGPIGTMIHHHDWWLGFVDLRGLTPENNVFVFDVEMPSEQFINIDNLQVVVVEFDTESWEATTLDIPAEHFIITGQPEGYEVSVQTVALSDVTFVGDAGGIYELTLDDIVVEINLNDRELITGPQPHPVRVSVPGMGAVWAVEELGNLIVHINVTPLED